jgi:hypothetical protein
MFYLPLEYHRCHNFQYFKQHTEIYWKKYSLSLHLVETDTGPDPDRQVLDADPDPDPCKIKGDPTGSTLLLYC